MTRLRNQHLFLFDLILLSMAGVLAFVLRLDVFQMRAYERQLLLFVALAVPIKLVVFYALGIYGRMWRYASTQEAILIGAAVSIATLIVAGLLFGLVLPLSNVEGFPRSVILIDALLTLPVVAGPRFAIRASGQAGLRSERRKQVGSESRVLVAGAGDAGAMIVREMAENPQLGLVPVGFVDDDVRKHGMQIRGVRVLGGREKIPYLVQAKDVAEVIIAMPSAPGAVVRAILDLCRQAGVSARTIPGLYAILSGQVSVSHLRPIDIEDLLRRDPVRTDISAVEQMLKGRRVLVTGAGGSIGAELCRQIARCRPVALIALGHGENSIFAVANELERLEPELPVARVIADVRDPDRLRQVFEAHRPEIIFHAAAHKHVPLMEENVAEAVTNNVQGTANLLKVAEAYHIARFVLISTDKAVNPTSVMGTCKRVAELLVQSFAQRTGGCYVAVRFGNVLGSRGSVVPFFREQIARGGPVTVTHPDIERFFMTIPEAVQLTLQAAALGSGGEVFVLDMGEPVRIADLAKDLIELSGFEVGRDIEIAYTGLRPGEKLYEELLASGEGYARTRCDKIMAVQDSRGTTSGEELERETAELIALAHRGDERQVCAKLRRMVPEFTGQCTAGTD